LDGIDERKLYDDGIDEDRHFEFLEK